MEKGAEVMGPLPRCPQPVGIWILPECHRAEGAGHKTQVYCKVAHGAGS